MRATLVRPAKGFWSRSYDELRRLTGIAVRSEGIKGPLGVRELQAFNDPASLDDCKLMTDADIGGFSTAHLDWVPPVGASSSAPATPAAPGHIRFHGTISTRLPANRPDIQRSGYAAWRTADRPPTVFGRSLWDVDSYAYLALRVRSDGRSYFINVQTDSMVAPTDLHQHRLFARRPGQWETVVVAWSDFVRTNHGYVVEPQTELMRQRVRSIGLGLTDRVPGPFSLGVARLWATNDANEALADADDDMAAGAEGDALTVDGVRASALSPAGTASDRGDGRAAAAAAAGEPVLKNKQGRPIQWTAATRKDQHRPNL